MKVLIVLLYLFSSAIIVFADIPPEPRENKQGDAGICAGALLLTAAIVFLGIWILKKRELQKNE